MFSYYGSKTNLVDLYPPPSFGKLIEPFAGSARYSLKYFDREVVLVDKYEVVYKIWKWLQECSPNDIKQLPVLTVGQTLNEFNFSCEAERLFMGFVIGAGANVPRTKVTDRIARDRPKRIRFTLNRVANNLFKIRHWDIRLDSYENIENCEATWFIDPPYQWGGGSYFESSKKIDFSHLANWCKTRDGQVIVCENTKADWMDFKPIIKQRGSLKTTTEAIWSNRPTAYDILQTKLF